MNIQKILLRAFSLTLIALCLTTSHSYAQDGILYLRTLDGKDSVLFEYSKPILPTRTPVPRFMITHGKEGNRFFFCLPPPLGRSEHCDELSDVPDTLKTGSVRIMSRSQSYVDFDSGLLGLDVVYIRKVMTDTTELEFGYDMMARKWEEGEVYPREEP